MLPLVAYALFGTSRTLSVGPVAVISLMTATAVGNIDPESPDPEVFAPERLPRQAERFPHF